MRYLKFISALIFSLLKVKKIDTFHKKLIIVVKFAVISFAVQLSNFCRNLTNQLFL